MLTVAASGSIEIVIKGEDASSFYVIADTMSRDKNFVLKLEPDEGENDDNEGVANVSLLFSHIKDKSEGSNGLTMSSIYLYLGKNKNFDTVLADVFDRSKGDIYLWIVSSRNNRQSNNPDQTYNSIDKMILYRHVADKDQAKIIDNVTFELPEYDPSVVKKKEDKNKKK